MVRTLKAFDIRGKNILLRVDFNVPMDGNLVGNNFRIKAALPTIKSCIDGGASVTIISHLGRPNGTFSKKLSLMPIGEELAKLLEMPIKFSEDCISSNAVDTSIGLKPGEIHLLENLRFHREEVENNQQFSKVLSKHGHIFINDAFGTTFTPDDRVIISRLQEQLKNDDKLENLAKNSSKNATEKAFEEVAFSLLGNLIDSDFKFYKKVQDDEKLSKFLFSKLFESYYKDKKSKKDKK